MHHLVGLKTFFLFLITIIFATSCAKNLEHFSEMEGMLKTKGGYDSYLALEYLSFSRSLASVEDKKISEYFAKKGLDLVNGEDVVPENPIFWGADPAQIEGMILMQKRLEMVLTTPHLKFYLPIQLAHLTYLYDCWISRESKALFRADELSRCRVRFGKLLEEIEHYVEDSKKDKQPKVEIKEPEFERFEVFFDFGSEKFNDKANKDMVAMLNYLGQLNGDYRILLIGKADRFGIGLYNQSLAFKRAEIVRNYLIKNGVAESLIEMRSAGETFPDILTKDGVQQQKNRVVEIYILKGVGSFSDFPLPLVQNKVYRQEIIKARKERGLND